jgi:HAD superfamily hydrolase (TIGR01509 family)
LRFTLNKKTIENKTKITIVSHELIRKECGGSMEIISEINKKLKGVLFDFNGVILLDSELQEQSWQITIYEVTGKKYSIHELRQVIHGRGIKDLINTLIDNKLNDNEINEIAHRKEKIYRELCLKNRESFQLTPNIINLFERLKKYKIPFTIASSASESDMKFYFEHLNLSQWFDWNKIAYFDGKIRTKPAPDLYLLGAKKLNLDPNDCCVIEDAIAGMLAALAANAGMIIAVSIERELPIDAKELAHIVIYSMDEINDFFINKYFSQYVHIDFPLYYICGLGN